MTQKVKSLTPYNPSDPVSIYEYSSRLMGHSLNSLFGEKAIASRRKGKGGLGQMVEELFFGYDINSNQEADFSEAGLELKCTPVKTKESDGGYTIKERLVCTMIDYFDVVNVDFEESHLLKKCRLMLLLFYLFVKGKEVCDYEFIIRILWQMPEKDLLLIKKDYETIVNKIRNGQAHLLSEGDTLYLGACRKGQKGDTPQKQPFSDACAMKRAFSLKPAYMRYVLKHATDSGSNAFSNYKSAGTQTFELVNAAQLNNMSFEDIILSRYTPFIGLNYIQICNKLGIKPYDAKSKYADVANLIASDGKSKRIANADEFQKSGIMIKTIRLRPNGTPKEAMAFKNIDYCEVFDNDTWTDSEAYEIFTSRFLFIVFKPTANSISFVQKNGETIQEKEYILDKAFFWTMPPKDLEKAKEYWQHIRHNVLENKINPDSFWHISDHRDFHVRPKAKDKKNSIAVNPNGGTCEKYCYWMNAEYIKRIIDGIQG